MRGTIKWFGQAGYLLRAGSSSIAIDLYFSDSIAGQGFVRSYPSPVEKGGLSVDHVVSTHNHGDHLDIETLRDYVSFGDFYGPSSCVEAMSSAGFSPQILHAIDRGAAVNAGGFALRAVYAEHTKDSIGVIVEACGTRLYFTGDSKFSEKLFDAAEYRPDVIFICINGKYGNMNWQDAVNVSKRLGVKAAVPMHYDMFPINSEDPSLFTSAFSASGIHSFTLEVGKEYDIVDIVDGNV